MTDNCNDKPPRQTYWRRVKYNNDSVESYPWELKFIAGKGLAAFSTRNFKAGDWICTEFPTVWISGHHPFTKDQILEIENKVSNLSIEDQVAFYEKENVFSDDAEKIGGLTAAAGIFMTNCFDMTDSIYGESCAMYLALARLNHSCCPNVQQTHYPDTTEEYLFAVRDINIGDEINDCYIELRQSKAERRASLLEFYRFECFCPGCCLPPDKEKDDDKARVTAREAVDRIVSLVEEDFIPAALELAMQTVKLLEDERYISWGIRYIAESCLYVRQIAQSLGEEDLAMKYLEKAHRMNVSLQGTRSPDSQNSANEIEKAKKNLLVKKSIYFSDKK